MSNVLLDEQAYAIDNVLNQYNIIGRCAGGTLTHRRLMLDVVLQPGTPLERIVTLHHIRQGARLQQCRRKEK